MNIFIFSWVDCIGLPHFFICKGSRKKAEKSFECFSETLDDSIKPSSYTIKVFKDIESLYLSKYSNKKLP